MAQPDFTDLSAREKEYDERVIAIDRVARVVAGGRRFRFRALVIVGDKQGSVGMGTAKAPDVTTAISKAVAQAKRRFIEVPITESGTIPHETIAKFSGAKILIKPAGPGTGVIAGGAVRQVIEAAGIKDILSKSHGSSNKINNASAALKALTQLAPATPAKPTAAKTSPVTAPKG